MQPSQVTLNAIPELLAADTATFAAVTAMHVHLVAQAFTPAPALVDATTLTLATFTGSAAKVAGTGTQQVFLDTQTGLLTLQVIEPVGGWTWECTATPGVPETIYGWILTDTADAEILGCALLAAPVEINSAGQGITVDRVRLAFSNNNPS